MSQINNNMKGESMAQIKVLESYPIELQAQPEKKFRDKETHEMITIEAQVARNATVVVGQAAEFTLPFILPASFDSSRVKVGDFLDVTCPGFESLRPLNIRNVNRIIPGKNRV